MKIRLPVVCPDCKTRTAISVDLNDIDVDAIAECGHRQWGALPNLSVGKKLLCRATQEFEAKEYPLVIVFSAMAVDCELSELYRKREQLRQYESNNEAPHIKDEVLEERLRSVGQIKKKIDHVAKLLGYTSLDAFVDQDTTFREQISAGFSSLSTSNFTDSVIEALFWPRNSILHFGNTSYGKSEAKICFNIARVLIDMLGFMDNERSVEFRKKHNAPI